jgi:hypothetical protein
VRLTRDADPHCGQATGFFWRCVETGSPGEIMKGSGC